MKLMKFVALGAVIAASSSMAFADSITVAGSDTFTNTGITFLNGGKAIVASTQDGNGSGQGGVYSSFLFSMATLTSFQFASAAGTTVFTVTNPAGQTLSFTIDGLTTETIGANANGRTLDLAGTGTFAETGMSDLSGTFSLTSSSAAPGSMDFSYQLIGSPAVTPEPNSLVLLGTGLIGAAGMMFMRRRNAAAGLF